jgi:DNA polymerase III subunit delta'
VFVLEGVDTMNDQAANRMLKTLEEPPAFAHLVLLTDRPGDVLPTIASRCQPVRFDAAPPEAIEALLSSRVDQDTARACSRLALGDGDRALALALGEGPALRAAVEAYARGCLAGDVAKTPWMALLARAKDLGDVAQGEVEAKTKADAEVLPERERKRAEREGADAAKRAGRRARTRTLDEALLLTGLWLRDVACVVDGAEDVVHATDRLAELRADAEGRDTHKLRRGVELVDETRAALTVNVTEELALEALAYRLVALLATG